VGAAIFYELDYRCEAQNADDFAESLKSLEFLKVPATVKEFTARRTLVQVSEPRISARPPHLERCRSPASGCGVCGGDPAR
jgi:hypothetical protein